MTDITNYKFSIPIKGAIIEKNIDDDGARLIDGCINRQSKRFLKGVYSIIEFENGLIVFAVFIAKLAFINPPPDNSYVFNSKDPIFKYFASRLPTDLKPTKSYTLVFLSNNGNMHLPNNLQEVDFVHLVKKSVVGGRKRYTRNKRKKLKKTKKTKKNLKN